MLVMPKKTNPMIKIEDNMEVSPDEFSIQNFEATFIMPIEVLTFGKGGATAILNFNDSYFGYGVQTTNVANKKIIKDKNNIKSIIEVNPSTYDNISICLLLLFVSSILIIFNIIFIKKKIK